MRNEHINASWNQLIFLTQINGSPHRHVECPAVQIIRLPTSQNTAYVINGHIYSLILSNFGKKTIIIIQCAAEKSGPLNFFAIFSATVWDNFVIFSTESNLLGS